MWMLLLLATVPLTATDADAVSALSWMTGCWATPPGRITIEEQWSKPSGGNMIGYSRTLRANGTVAFAEFMRIDAKDGAILYTPRIGTSQAPVAFRLIKSAPTEAVFENPTHDFPQRIIYRREGDNLHAAVEGNDKGKPRREDFPYRKVPCE
jgi:hypothetical protein